MVLNSDRSSVLSQRWKYLVTIAALVGVVASQTNQCTPFQKRVHQTKKHNFHYTMDLQQGHGTFPVSWKFWTTKDRLKLSLDGKKIFDTGMVSGSGKKNVTFTAGSGNSVLSIRIKSKIYPDDLSSWNVKIGCPYTCNPFRKWVHQTNKPNFHSKMDLAQKYGTFPVSWKFQTTKDQLKLWLGGKKIFDTGLISGSGNKDVTFDAGSGSSVLSIHVKSQIFPHDPSSWNVKIGCPDPTIPCGDCDDGDHCTNDHCDEITDECVHEPVTCQEGEVCDSHTGDCEPVEHVVPCVAVIDEWDNRNYAKEWASFRKKYPKRPFCLLVPSKGVQTLPTGFDKDTVNNPDPVDRTTVALVNRDSGKRGQVSDWFTLCNLSGLSPVSVNFIGLFVDTSGSMTLNTVRASYDKFLKDLADAGLTNQDVFNGSEQWIAPFLTDLAP